jgi:hypothetical protein
LFTGKKKEFGNTKRLKSSQGGEGKELDPRDSDGLSNTHDWFTTGLWPVTFSVCGHQLLKVKFICIRKFFS